MKTDWTLQLFFLELFSIVKLYIPQAVHLLILTNIFGASVMIASVGAYPCYRRHPYYYYYRMVLNFKGVDFPPHIHPPTHTRARTHIYYAQPYHYTHIFNTYISVFLIFILIIFSIMILEIHLMVLIFELFFFCEYLRCLPGMLSGVSRLHVLPVEEWHP